MKNKILSNFLAITPLDGRNYHKIPFLSDYFSEFALNKQRLAIEIKYLIFLSQQNIAPKLSFAQQRRLAQLVQNFDLTQMKKINLIEKKFNHETKAVEYYLKSELKKLGLENCTEFVHWALTSEDINNLATSISLQQYFKNHLFKEISATHQALTGVIKTSAFPIVGRTHGQPASITTLAKELVVYLARLQTRFALLQSVQLEGKLNGAVGSFWDQYFVLPQKNWPKLAQIFIKQLALKPVAATTQILPYDSYLLLFSHLSHLQNIAIDLCQNLWQYTSFNYLKQQNIAREVGSSVMPQKINPIYLEGAEGGFELSNALLDFYSRKLSKSRLQRDLSDSTVRRSFGIALGYSHLSWQSLTQGINRLSPNPKQARLDIDQHWEIFGSAIQTYLRLHHYHQPYEIISKKLKGKTLTRDQFMSLIDSLQLPPKEAKKLRSLTPEKIIKPTTQIVQSVLK